MSQIMALDAGTTGLKLSAFDQDGNLLVSSYEEYPTFYPKDTYVEQNPDDWWGAFCRAARKLLHEGGKVKRSELICLVSSGQMSTAIPVDRNGNVLLKPIFIWADMRTGKEVAELDKRLGPGRFYQLTGAGLVPETYSFAKIMWLKNNLPDVFERTYKFLQVKDYITFRLTGRFVTDYSDASDSGMLGLTGQDWSEEILRAAEIPREKLPELLPSIAVAGKVGAKAAADTGLPEGLPVVVGGGDVCCAATGAGAVEKGVGYIYIGSATWIGVCTDRPLIQPATRMLGLRHVVPDHYAPHHIVFGGGICYQWFKNTLGEAEILAAKLAGTDAYELLNYKAQQSSPGARGIVFLPYMRGGGAPYHNPDARGVFLGLDVSHNKADLIRGLLEGVAFCLRQMVEDFEESGVQVRELRIIGGGARSSSWRQIIADISHKPIYRTTVMQEGNTLGASLIGAVAMGIFKTFSEGAANWIKVVERSEPKLELQPTYDALYKIFKEAYHNMVPIYKNLAVFRKEYL